MVGELLCNAANLITFFGVGCAVAGVFFAFTGQVDLSVVMLILAGIADAFDGPVARKYNKGGKSYGVYLDALADIVSSGVLVVCICMALGFTSVIDLLIYILFVMCGVIRLAYYNINSSNRKDFVGVPITTAIILLPIIYLVDKKCEPLFMVSLTILALLFVVNIKVKKPTLKIRAVLAALGVLAIVLVLLTMFGVF